MDSPASNTPREQDGWTPLMLEAAEVWRQRLLELEAEVKFLRELLTAIVEKQR